MRTRLITRAWQKTGPEPPPCTEATLISNTPAGHLSSPCRPTMQATTLVLILSSLVINPRSRGSLFQMIYVFLLNLPLNSAPPLPLSQSPQQVYFALQHSLFVPF